MRLSRRISRRRNVRLMTAVMFVASGTGAFFALRALDSPAVASAAIALGIVLSSVVIALAPSATMHERWFHVLPILTTVETGVVMWAAAPRSGAAAVTFVFVGALVAFLFESRREMLAQLGFASLVLVSPLVAGQADVGASLTIVTVLGAMWGLWATIATVWSHAEHAAAQLDALAQRDALTGVGNRRMLDERLEYELVQHTRSGGPLALLVLDLNGFKEINDTLGHAAGDDILRDVALAVAGTVRARDTVARPGGDEFCVLAPETDADAARELANRVRAAVSEKGVGAAIGVAVFPDDATSARALFEAADAHQRDDKPGAPRRTEPAVG